MLVYLDEQQCWVMEFKANYTYTVVHKWECEGSSTKFWYHILSKHYARQWA